MTCFENEISFLLSLPPPSLSIYLFLGEENRMYSTKHSAKELSKLKIAPQFNSLCEKRNSVGLKCEIFYKQKFFILFSYYSFRSYIPYKKFFYKSISFRSRFFFSAVSRSRVYGIIKYCRMQPPLSICAKVCRHCGTTTTTTATMMIDFSEVSFE